MSSPRSRFFEIVTLLAALAAAATAQVLFRHESYMAGIAATVLAVFGGWAVSGGGALDPERVAEPRSSAWPKHPLPAILSAVALATTLLLRGRDDADLWQLVLWASSIALINAAYAQPQWLRGHAPTVAVVVVLMATALALRVYRLDGLPDGFHADEGELGLLALDLVDGIRVHPFAAGWGETPTLMTYLHAVGIWMTGENVSGVRMVSAIAGSLTVVALFVLLRSTAGFWPAMLSAILLAFSPWHMFFSRLALPDFVVALCTVVVMLALVLGVTKTSPSHYVLAGTAAGLCFYFANKAIVLLPTAAGAWLVLFFVRPREMMRQLHLWLLALVVAIAVFAPQLLYFSDHGGYHVFLSHPSFRWILSPSNLVAAKALYHVDSVASVMAHQVERSLLAFQYYPDAGPFLSFTGAPLLTAVEGTFFVVGLGECLRRCREPMMAVLLAWFAVGLQTSILADHPPQAHRMIGIVALPSIFAMLPLDRLRRLLAALPFARAASVASGVTVLAAAAIAASGAYAFFVTYPRTQPWSAVTMVARVMREYGRDHLVVPVEVPIMWGQNGTIRFIARGVQPHPVGRLDPDQRWRGPSDRDVAFLFLRRPSDQLNLLREWYPHGVERPIDQQPGRRTVTMFVVPRADLTIGPPVLE